MDCLTDENILSICRYEYNYFLNKINVIGVGLGYKIINGITTTQKAILVFVCKKVSLSLLSKDNQIPQFYKNIPTDVIESGPIQVRSLTDRIRPVLGGYDFGPIDKSNSGTYGGLVRDNNGIYMLSNNHTIAGSNDTLIGTNILQPSPNFGGTSPMDIVSVLDRYILLRFSQGSLSPINFVDAALGKIINSAFVSAFITFIGIPSGITPPILGQQVQMACSTSEYLSGTISAIGATFLAIYPDLGKTALFVNQIFFASSIPSQSGDSGALVLDSSRKAVGLFFASSDRTCVVNPINAVLSLLGVSLVINQ